MRNTMIERKTSAALFEEAKHYFPGGVNSPVRAFKSVEGPPVFVKEGKGCHLFDEDGNRFLDFCCSWGPLILGHAHPDILSFLHETLDKGTSFGTPSRLGNQLGKLITENHSYLDQIRFVSSGTEAVMSAIRLARGITGKDHLVKFEGCYHGHVDSLMVKAGSGLATFGTSSSAGIPKALAEMTIVLPLDDEEALDACLAEHHEKIAAVIIEPIPANNGLLIQRKAYLQHLREKCTEYGILLIFDEVISGFRVGFEGAAGLYDIQPDLLTFGKIIGGGMPVGAFAGRRAMMKHVAPEGEVYQAGTLSANPMAMAAGFATLTELLKPGFYNSLEETSAAFIGELEQHISEKGYDAGFQRIGSIFWLKFSQETIRRSDQIDASKMELFKRIHAHLLHDGVYLGPSGYEVGFISAVHKEDDMQEALDKMKNALDRVLGG
jgi:glutamate-1-semialdehyde 2,1-aminomutase